MCISSWRKILRREGLEIRYYSPTLKKDALTYAKKCDRYQKLGNLHQKSSNYLTHILFTLHFAKWDMDILGLFPVAAGQKKFVIMVVNYFTKWVEAEAVRGITTNDVRSFIWKNIITRFVMP